jgi:hypothetical protein
MKRIKRKTEVVARSVAGAHLLIPLHGTTKSVYTLNTTGCRLWEMIAEPRVINELASALVDQYHIPHETALRDVEAFLEDMRRMKLIEEAD